MSANSSQFDVLESQRCGSRPVRSSAAPSGADTPSQEKPKWFQRSPQLGFKGARKLSQRAAVVSAMSPRQRKLWKLQQMAMKKQQAFQEAVQSIPVSEMEKLIAASSLELERAQQNYEKCLMANEGKGRYLWAKLRELVTVMDAETKLRIKLLPLQPLDGDRDSPSPGGGQPQQGPSESQPTSKGDSPRVSAPSSKSGTPRVAGGSVAAGGSKLNTPRALLRAAASNAAGGQQQQQQQPPRIEINKRPEPTVFRWRTGVHVKLATDLPAELLRYRNDHNFDKYDYSPVLKEPRPNVNRNSMACFGLLSMLSPRHERGGGGMVAARRAYRASMLPPNFQRGSLQLRNGRSTLLPLRFERGSVLPTRASQTGMHVFAGAPQQQSSASPAPAQSRATSHATKAPSTGKSRAPSISSGAAAKQTAARPGSASPAQAGCPASPGLNPAAQFYGEQWAVPPRLWARCSELRLQGEDPLMRLASEAVGPRRGSTDAKAQELAEKIATNEDVQAYARELARQNKRLPDYLQKAISSDQQQGRGAGEGGSHS